MSLMVHPRWAPPGLLRMWVGDLNQAGARALSWRLDESPVAARALRPLARPDPVAQAGSPGVFTGVYELDAPAAPGRRTVTVSAGNEQASARFWTTPAELPTGPGESLNVLLVSCFHREAQPFPGVLGTTLGRIQKATPLHLALLLGDQVYLDLPAFENFPDESGFLLGRFEGEYTANWCGREGWPSDYSRVLAAAPSACIPDDHEYWNNFPHKAAVVQNTWTAAGRDRWRSAAASLYAAFQLAHPLALGDALEFDVPPLSFFLADTRSFRDPGLARSVSASSLPALAAWVARLNANGLVGVFASGQSVFADPVGALRGSVFDRGLPDYGDFGAILRSLTACQGNLLCLTGDVHWGRVMQARDATAGRDIFEVVTSPAALVNGDGVLPWKQGWSWLRGERWPRHRDAAPAPESFASPRYACASLHGQKGDQLAVLSFRRHGSGVQAEVAYWSLHADELPPTIVPLPFPLRGRIP